MAPAIILRMVDVRYRLASAFDKSIADNRPIVVTHFGVPLMLFVPFTPREREIIHNTPGLPVVTTREFQQRANGIADELRQRKGNLIVSRGRKNSTHPDYIGRLSLVTEDQASKLFEVKVS